MLFRSTISEMGTLFQGVDSMGHCPWDVPGMGTEKFQGSKLRIAGHTCDVQLYVRLSVGKARPRVKGKETPP